MHVTSVWPYFVLMPLIIGVSGLVARLLRVDMTQLSPKLNVPLESIRGLLAANVLFCHAIVTFYYFKDGSWDAVPTSFYQLLGTGSVAIFFFISSFLLWSRCLERHGVGKYGRYLQTRARRILPAYYASVVVLLVVVLVRSRFTLQVPLLTLAGQVLDWLLFSFGSMPHVNGLAEAPYINAGVFWTLQFEVVFYLLLPLLYLIFKGRRLFLFLLPLGAIYWNLVRQGVSFTADPHNSNGGSILALGLATFFGFGFGGGMLVAYLNQFCPAHWKQILRQRRWTFIPLVCLVLPFFLGLTPYSFGQFLLLSVFFVFLAAGNDLFGLLSRRAVFHLGTVSYSFYITHGIVLFVLSHLLHRWVAFQTLSPLRFWCFTAVAGAVVVCFSTLLSRTIEYRWISRSSALAMPRPKEMPSAPEPASIPVLAGGSSAPSAL